MTLARHGKTVGFLVSRERMEAIVEPLEIMGNPTAIKAVRGNAAGGARWKDAACLNKEYVKTRIRITA